MSIFNRIQGLLVAGVNHAVDVAENPELMLKQAVREIDQTIREARVGVVRAVAGEKQLAAQLQRHRRAATGLHAEAEQAVAAGRRDLAVKALHRKAEHEHTADEIEAAWNASRDGCAMLKARLDRLAARREALCHQRDALVARQRAAEARTALCRSTAHLEVPEGAEEKFARMSERVNELEAESLAFSEMVDESQICADEIAGLEIDARVCTELEAIELRRQQPANGPGNG